jgi:hypothetical protein
LVAKLPVQTCRFKLRISVNLCKNFRDPFLDTTGLEPRNAYASYALALATPPFTL